MTAQGFNVRGLANRMKHYPAGQIVAGSTLFDADWYLATNPDILSLSREAALSHYLEYGAREHRDPGPLFDTGFYLAQFPKLDVRRINPVCHYLVYGEVAGAWPNRFFDPLHVAAQLDKVRPGENVLARYVALGPTLVAPSASFDAGAYVAANPLLAQSGLSPLWHRLFQERSVNAFDVLVSDDYTCAEHNHLQILTVKDGLVHFHVTGDDPHLVLTRRDAQKTAPGHYRLRFQFEGPKGALDRAKAYFDLGSGFSEVHSTNLNFQEKTQGWFETDLALDEPLLRLRLDPTDGSSGAPLFFGIGKLQLAGLSRSAYYGNLLERATPSLIGRLKLVSQLGAGAVLNSAQTSQRLRELRQKQNASKSPQALAQATYKQWIDRFDTITDDDRRAMAEMTATFSTRPTISVVMPVYNTPETLLRECIDSVLDQTYPDWELCIADDKSTTPHVRTVLERYAAADPRIKVVYRSENGHISRASNSAIEIATGEWIALLDHDDLLAPHALFCIAEAINRHPDAKLIYSDEDKIDLEGNRTDPYFKSDWNYHLFLSQNMFSHLGAYKADLVHKVGGFRPGFEGAQDYDLALRCLENVERSQIIHIPHVLYNWRVMPGSTALSSDEKPYAMIAGERALCSHFERIGLPATSELRGHGYALHLKAPAFEPSVSIIIPTRDGGAVLERCLDSIEKLTGYQNHRLVLIDNGSKDPATLSLLELKRRDRQVSIIRDDRPFNYSQLNNDAAASVDSEILVFLNDDTEVHDKDWITHLVSHANRPEIGAVGARLWYPDGSLQHGGLVLSTEHIAINIHKGMPRDHFGYFGRGALIQDISAVTAACLAVRREVFESVGGFDAENLGIAYNDVDLCLKIQAAGYTNLLLPSVNLTHYESASRGSDFAPEKRDRLEREKKFMRDKWGALLGRDPYYNPNLSTLSDDFSRASPPRITLPWRSLPTS